MRNSEAGVEQAEVVVNFSHGPDSGPWIPLYGSLLDGDCRRKPLDAGDLRLVDPPEESTGIGGE